MPPQNSNETIKRILLHLNGKQMTRIIVRPGGMRRGTRANRQEERVGEYALMMLTRVLFSDLSAWANRQVRVNNSHSPGPLVL